jgi:uncharacterized protein (TIGR03067 family)
MNSTFVLLLAIFISSLQSKESNQKEIASLEGTWIAVGAEEKGKKITQDELQNQSLTMIFKGDKVSIIEGKGKPKEYSFTLDLSKKPAHFDLKEEGKGARKGIIPAIYSFEQNKLVICMGSNFSPDEEEKRPQTFATGESEERPKKGKLMFIFEKKK